MGGGSRQKVTYSDALKYLKDVKDMFHHKKEIYEEFIDVTKNAKVQSVDITIARVKELFKGYNKLILGFNAFLPKGYEITLSQEDEPHAKKPVEFEGAIHFVNKMKMRFQDDDHVYKSFLDILSMYRKGNKSISEVHHEVSALLHDQPDLLMEFTNFLPGSSAAASDQYVYSSRNHNPFHGDRSSPIGTIRPLLSSNDEYQAKPIHKFDLSDCERCTPSYRLLPKNYPIPKASQRTKIGAEVLNDHWVSVTSGSENYSFKNMHRNQYEKSLFRCEDDRFELDMLIESVNVTARRVEEHLDMINYSSIKTGSMVRVEDHFTALNLRCIGRLYGDNGFDVMDILKKNASLALPVLLTRLKQKHEEWARCRFDFNKVWADIYAKNHHKSLDHHRVHSFYFKKRDSKSLSAEALLAEIKKISEEKSNEENIYQHFATRKRRNTLPRLEFKYSDLAVHEDLYQLMKYYIPQNSTPEQVDKVMKIWTTFVEPMFNVPCRPQSVDDSQDVEKTSNPAVKCVGTIVRQNDGDNGHGMIGFKRSIKGHHYGSSRVGLVNDNNDVKEDNNGKDSSLNEAIARGGRIKRRRNDTGTILSKESYQNRYCESGLENEADEEGEKSAHRSLCVSENAFENGGGSGRETADVEDGSPVKHCGLTKYVPEPSLNEDNISWVFYGNDAFYVFFRLHQMLYSRLEEAKEKSANDKWMGSNDTTPNNSYTRFLDLLHTFLGGAIDSSKYEDECRTILGTWSFPLFTLDKLIYKLSKQLLAIAVDEVDNKLLRLYAYEHMRKRGRFVDELYNANARVIVNDDSIYRFESSLIPVTDRHTQLTIQLMDSGFEMSEAPAFSIDPSFAAYPSSRFLPADPGKRSPEFS